MRPVVAALAWHLRAGGAWRALLPAGFPPWRTVYGWFRRRLDLGPFDALLRAIARLRRRVGPWAGGRSRALASPTPKRWGASRRPRATGLRRRQEHLGPQARGAGGCRGALARRRRGPPLGAEDRDALPALDAGKARWPSLREAVVDGAFAADRCRAWSNPHGMRHRVAERDPAAKGFVVITRRRVVERSFGWLAHWGGLARDRAGRPDVAAARLALAAPLSGVEALLNPMPIRDEPP